jgi:hypothetical protein
MIPPGIFFEVCTRLLGRFDASRPFHRDGWLWATDGRIVVRCRIDPQEVGTLNAGRRLPDPTGTIRDLEGRQGRSVPLPAVDEFEPCRQCGGPGDSSCALCDGHGRVPLRRSVRISDDPDITLSSHYVAMLRRNGVEAVDVYAGAKLPVFFREPGDGFEGWLMPTTSIGREDLDDEDFDEDLDDEDFDEDFDEDDDFDEDLDDDEDLDEGEGGKP